MKKRKIALAAMAAAVLSVSAGGLSACAGDNGPTDADQENAGVFTITFNANNGHFADNASTKDIATLNGKLVTSPETPTYANHTFAGWSLQSDASGEIISAIADYTFVSSTSVYAHWTATPTQQSYDVTFDPAGGQFPVGAVSVLSTDANGKVSLPAQNPTKNGYTFAGWYTEEDGGDEVTADTVYNKATTVYAHWTEIVYSGHAITLVVGENGTLADGAASLTTDEDGKVTLPTPTVAEGYTFDGWFTAATGGDKVTSDTVHTGPATLYAQYTEQGEEPEVGVYKVTFDLNGGKIDGSGANIELTTAEGLLAAFPANPELAGSEFVGWYTNKEEGRGVKMTVESTFTAETTLYARWKPAAVALDNAIVIGGEEAAINVDKLTANENNGYQDIQLSAVNVELSANAEVSFKYEGEEVEFGWWRGDSPATEAKSSGNKSIKVLASGKYSFYLKHYQANPADESSEANWYIVAKLDVALKNLTPATDKGADDWYITGDMTGNFGDLYKEFKLNYSEDNEQFEAEVDLPAYATLNIVNGTKTTWIDKGSNWIFGADSGIEDGVQMIKGGNLATLVAGTYGFYFKPATATTEAVVYVALKKAETPDVPDVPDVPTTGSGVLSVGDKTQNMTSNKVTPAENNGYNDIELYIADVELKANDVVSFKYDDGDVEFGWWRGDSPATEAKASGNKSVKVLADGKYSFALKHYSKENSDGAHWYIVAKLDVEVEDLTPATDKEKGADDWYITGDMAGGFDNLCKEYKFTYNRDKGQYELLKAELPAYTTLKVVNGEHKVWVGGAWVFNADSGITDGTQALKADNLVILVGGKYSFYYVPAADKTPAAVYVVLEKAETQTPDEPDVPDVPTTGSGVLSVGDETQNMTSNKVTPAENNGYNDIELYIADVELKANDVVSFKYDDGDVEFGWWRGDSPATEAKASGNKSVKVLADGKYSFTLKHYSKENSDGAHWYIVAKLDVEVEDLTPATDKEKGADDWYITGDMAGGFDNLCKEYKFTYNRDKGQYELLKAELPAYTTLKVVNGEHKVWVGGAWVFNADSGITDGTQALKADNLVILVGGKYSFYYVPAADKTPAAVYVVREKEEGETPEVPDDPTIDKKDGIYLGEELAASLWQNPDNAGEKMSTRVELKKDDEIVLIIGGKDVTGTLKNKLKTDKVDGVGSQNVKLEDGKIVVLKNGYFDFYYDTRDVENGGGLYIGDYAVKNIVVGSKETELTDNSKNFEEGDIAQKKAEYMILGIELEKDQTVKFVFGGEQQVFTVKQGAVGLADNNNDPSKNKAATVTKTGKYNIYIALQKDGDDYWKVWCAECEEEEPEEPEVKDENKLVVGDEKHDLVKNVVEPTKANGYNDLTLTISDVVLKADDVVSFKYNGQTVKFDWWQNSSPATEAQASGNKSIKVLSDGTYSFTLNHYSDDNDDGAHWYIVADIEVEELTGLTEAATPTAAQWYLTGDVAGGKLYTELKLVNNEAEGQYELLNVELPAYARIELVSGDKKKSVVGAWQFGDDSNIVAGKQAIAGDELITLVGGKYSFYFKPATGNTEAVVYVALKKDAQDPSDPGTDPGTDPGDPQTAKDGIYTKSGTLIAELKPKGDNEIAVRYVTLKKDDDIVIWRGGDSIVAKLKADSGDNKNSKNISDADNKLVILKDGTYSFYYQFQGDSIGLWVVDETDYVPCELTTGDGMYVNAEAGALVAAFKVNEGAEYEIMATDVIITASTQIKFVYGGKPLTGIKLNASSAVAESALASDVLTLGAGVYSLYYNYSTQSLYVGKALEAKANIKDCNVTFVFDAPSYAKNSSVYVYHDGGSNLSDFPGVKFGKSVGDEEFSPDGVKLILVYDDDSGSGDPVRKQSLDMTEAIDLVAGGVYKLSVGKWDTNDSNKFTLVITHLNPAKA